MRLDLATFEAFFAAVNEQKKPFQWQRLLAEKVLAGEWPTQVPVPTACGKTHFLDIAVFALACQAGPVDTAPAALNRTAPLRVFYVIDRRLVVDEVGEHARRLALALRLALNKPDAPPILSWVARRLMLFGGSTPLQVVTLRGGLYVGDAWAIHPNQPTICVTTVDQVGSRLLFRGYGVRPFRRPVHAALAGCDALYVVDEAHLVEPLRQTLATVKAYQSAPWVTAPVAQPIRVVTMTGTPLCDSEEELPAQLYGAALNDPALQQRLGRPKPVQLLEEKNVVAGAVREAQRLAGAGYRVVGIYANDVKTTRQIYTDLKRNHEVVLLTGRARPWDRERVTKGLLARIGVARRTAGEQPRDHFFCVMTQCAEVGANFDFDAVVSVAAPLDSLRQRLARLNRLGYLEQAPGVLILPWGSKEDPVYGAETQQTWEWLQRHARPTDHQEREIDFSVMQLHESLTRDWAPKPEADRAPALHPSLVELLVQTHPRPHPDPDVSPFLHGVKARESADVLVVWRADLPGDLSADRLGEWQQALRLAPAVAEEAMPVPLWAVRRWLRGEEEAAPVPDQEGLDAADAAKGVRSRKREQGQKCGSIPGLCWRGPDEISLANPASLRPGDVVVVPAIVGGTDHYGWDPEATEPVIDCADRCANRRSLVRASRGLRARVRVRVYPRLVQKNSELQAALRAAIHSLAHPPDADEDEGNPLYALAEALVESGEGGEAAGSLLHAGGRLLKGQLYLGGEGVVLTAPAVPAQDELDADPELTLPGDDDGELPRATDKVVPLGGHQQGVAKQAREMARGCGLPAQRIRDLELAGLVHDEGKADPRMQLVLCGGSELQLDRLAEPVAKSLRELRDQQGQRVRQALPAGFRHEALSATLLRVNEEPLRAAADSELVVHLVGTHHGRGRPLMPPLAPDDLTPAAPAFPGVSREALGAAWTDLLDHWPEQFQALCQRYGYWGLAYLETIVRLADGVQSDQEERGGEG